jgi:hypothetical protein
MPKVEQLPDGTGICNIADGEPETPPHVQAPVNSAGQAAPKDDPKSREPEVPDLGDVHLFGHSRL